MNHQPTASGKTTVNSRRPIPLLAGSCDDGRPCKSSMEGAEHGAALLPRRPVTPAAHIAVNALWAGALVGFVVMLVGDSSEWIRAAGLVTTGAACALTDRLARRLIRRSDRVEL